MIARVFARRPVVFAVALSSGWWLLGTREIGTQRTGCQAIPRGCGCRRQPIETISRSTRLLFVV